MATACSSRTRHHIRECNDKKAVEKKKKLACLVADYLDEEGYNNTAACFRTEVPLLQLYDLCDNMSLARIVCQFEEYYLLKFQKEARICKKSAGHVAAEEGAWRTAAQSSVVGVGTGESCSVPRPPLPSTTARSVDPQKTGDRGRGECVDRRQPAPPKLSMRRCRRDSLVGESPPQLDITCTAIFPQPETEMGPAESDDILAEDLGGNTTVSWEDVVGQEQAKNVLRMSVLFPSQFPQLFGGLVQPACSVLLYGPPGTGKTMLAKAVAASSRTSLFNVIGSNVISKWRGDSEKQLRAIFHAAHARAPSIIFMDELDAIACRRGAEGEHEASRRLLAELLVLMDGLSTSTEQHVFLLAATNVPWQLDPAVIRRFEVMELVDLPNLRDREQLLKLCLPDTLSEQLKITVVVDHHELAEQSAGLSCCDLRAACKRAILQQVYVVAKLLEQGGSLKQVRPSVVTTQHISSALYAARPCDSGTVARYHTWQGQPTPTATGLV